MYFFVRLFIFVFGVVGDCGWFAYFSPMARGRSMRVALGIRLIHGDYLIVSGGCVVLSLCAAVLSVDGGVSFEWGFRVESFPSVCEISGFSFGGGSVRGEAEMPSNAIFSLGLAFLGLV